MNKKRPLPSIVIFAILTVITTFVWIGFDIYRALTQESPPDVPSAVLLPLDPSLDTEVLNSVAQSIYLSEDEIGGTELFNFDALEATDEAIDEIVEEDTNEEDVVQETDEATQEENNTTDETNQEEQTE